MVVETKEFKLRHVVFLALLSGFIAVFGMFLYWNLLDFLIGRFISLPQIDSLSLTKEGFLWAEFWFYNAKVFTASLLLSSLYYLATKFMPKRPIWGLIFYSLFASIAFVFFVGFSVMQAADLTSLMVLFLFDDLPQAMLVMLPIVMFAPIDKRHLLGS